MAEFSAQKKSAFNGEFHLFTRKIISDLPRDIVQHPIYTANNFTYFQKLRLIKNLRKIKKDFDVLHYIFTPTKQNVFLLKHFVGCKKKGVKTIQTIATLREDLYSDKEIKELMFSDLIVTYSDYAKNKLNALGLNNVKRVYPGIDLEYYFPQKKDDSIIKRFNFKNGDFIVVYPGEYSRLGATDDIVNMIEKYRGILEKNNVRIVFACRLKNDADKKKKSEVEKRLKEKKCLHMAVFTDTFSDMAKLYNLSDVIIFPARNMRGKFDVPLAIIEPMACEKPVIVSDLPVLKEFTQNDNSVTIKKGNISQLKEAILDLRKNPEKRSAIGKASRQFAKENFDIKKIAAIYQKIYEII